MSKIKSCLILLRPHQWIKNLLVLAPLFFSGHFMDKVAAQKSLLALVIFSLVASAVYIMNDLRDRDADKLNAKKKSRPLASGAVSVGEALTLMALLLVSAIGVLVFLQPPSMFIAILALYLAINIGYSLGLKHVALFEIFLVASGYMLRLVAGSLIVDEALSKWIIVVTALVALLLAAGKRRGEIAQENDTQKRRKSLEGYTLPYLDQVISLLGASTVVTYLLFCISDYADKRFGDHAIWSAVFVLFGILRYIQIVIVEKGGDSPTALLCSDKQLLATIFCFTLFFLVILY